MQVLVLEAGRSRRWMDARFLFERARRRFRYRAEHDARALDRQRVQSQCYAWPHHPRAFVDDLENPYSTPHDKPFAWIRSRQEGGRMVIPLNGLQFYRFSDLEFKAASRDGFGVDWPISYRELEPYYDRVEGAIGISGNRDDIRHLPNPISGPSVALTPAESHLRSAIVNQWPDRQLIVRRTAARAPFPLHDARRTGRLSFRAGAVAREILADPDTGRARGVAWLEGGIERSATSRLVVVAASTIESTRLLLNSRSPRHPDGFGNSSGTLGCYLMDHTSISGLDAAMPLPASKLSPVESGAYIPQFRNVDATHPDFLRGYGIQVWSKGDRCALTVRGEMLPRRANRVSIDPVARDRWGIPCARIECEYGDNERAQSADAIVQCRAMLLAAGFDIAPGEARLGTPGLAIHECGTARMGHDARTSVLNRYNQCWDARNVFVVDGASFVSQGAQNPTLTIMALALRAAEHIVDSCRRHEL